MKELSEMQAATGIENLDSKIEKGEEKNDGVYKADGDYANPVANFLIALKAPETKRQYPKRLDVFFDFLKLDGSFEDKALCFYQQALENPR